MHLSKSQVNAIRATIAGLQAMLEGPKEPAHVNVNAKRRPTGKELLAFRKTLMAERKAGVSVALIAEEHGVTPSYIYQL